MRINQLQKQLKAVVTARSVIWVRLMYMSVHRAQRTTIDYNALLRASARPAAVPATSMSPAAAAAAAALPPQLAEMGQASDANYQQLVWLLTASPLAAGLSSADDDDDDADEAAETTTTTTQQQWRRLVRAGLPPSTPVCSLDCTDPVLILRTLAHWCVSWRDTPAPFIELLFLPEKVAAAAVGAAAVSAQLSVALRRGDLTDLSVRDAAERVVHARGNWTKITTASIGGIGSLCQYLNISRDLHIKTNHANVVAKCALICPIRRPLLAAAVNSLHTILVVAAEDARHARGLLVQDSLDLLEFLLQNTVPPPVGKPTEEQCRRTQHYVLKSTLDRRQAEAEGWFLPGGLRSAHLLAWLLCSNTMEPGDKLQDTRPFGLMDGNGAPPEIILWCSNNLLAPRFLEMHDVQATGGDNVAEDERIRIKEISRMRCARSVLVRAAMNIGAADLAVQCAANGGCGGRVPLEKTQVFTLLHNWTYYPNEMSRKIAPPVELGRHQFFMNGASVDHFGQRLIYRLVRAAALHWQEVNQSPPSWFLRAILLYPATLELVLRTLLLDTSAEEDEALAKKERWALQEQFDGSAFVRRNAAEDAPMIGTVVTRVMDSYAAVPELVARGQVLVLLRVLEAAVATTNTSSYRVPASFWETSVIQVLDAMRGEADVELLAALAKLAGTMNASQLFCVSAAVLITKDNNHSRDAAFAHQWAAAGTTTDEVVEKADACWRFSRETNFYLAAVQRARRMGCPWGPNAGWYASESTQRMRQLEEVNAWIVSENGRSEEEEEMMEEDED